jgi:tRNA A37 threonylcarbamoyladenosine dehydratase
MKLETNSRYIIYVLGAGGTGSHLLPLIAQLLSKYNWNALKIIDGDMVRLLTM